MPNRAATGVPLSRVDTAIHSGIPPIRTKIAPGMIQPQIRPSSPPAVKPYSRKFQPRLRKSAGQPRSGNAAQLPPTWAPA
jgi:hypothetical protein